MKIVLLFGGRGGEYEVSLLSASYVLCTLTARGYTVYPIGIDRTGAFFRYTGDPAVLDSAWKNESLPVSMILKEGALFFSDASGEVFSPSLVFSVVHGKDGEDGSWQGLLTLTRTPFVGSGVSASALCMNKRLSKELASLHGIPTVPFLTARAYTDELCARVAYKLRYPLFVKPTSGGSSVGVSRVEKECDLRAAVSLALSEDEEAIIEEAVDGSELEVAVLARDGALLLSPPGEIVTEAGFYDYNTKYSSHTARFHLPAQLSLWEGAYVKQLAAAAFRLFGCRDLARVDFLRRTDGKIFFNEINTLPGFTAESLFHRLFGLIGVDPLTFLVEGRT